MGVYVVGSLITNGWVSSSLQKILFIVYNKIKIDTNIYDYYIQIVIMEVVFSRHM